MIKRISLEPEAIAVADASAVPPMIFQLPPARGRQILEEAQNTPVHMYPVNIQKAVIDTGKWGRVQVYVVSSLGVSIPSNVILYIHGGGWVLGSFHTHEKLVRELAARTGSVVVFPEYSRSPEAHFPVAIEQCYEVLVKTTIFTGKG